MEVPMVVGIVVITFILAGGGGWLWGALRGSRRRDQT